MFLFDYTCDVHVLHANRANLNENFLLMYCKTTH